MQPYPEERLVERLVTYTVEMDGRLYVIEHVPARVNVETEDQYFAPETGERVQQTMWGKRTPTRTIQTLIFDFAA